jgi:MFS transporter, DHA1 family, multidrug resistance protein
MWLSGFALILNFFSLPETSSLNILYRRSRRLRKLTGNQKLRSQGELISEQMTSREIALMVLVWPFTLNFLEPIVFLLNLYIALVYALLYVWFESFELVFVELYGFNLGQEGLSYVGIMVGALVVIPPFFAYLYYVLEPQFNENGDIGPEKRMPPAFVGAFAIPICLFWFGWTANVNVHWIVPIVGSGLFSVGAFLLFVSLPIFTVPRSRPGDRGAHMLYP